jgi:hypothetical protein
MSTQTAKIVKIKTWLPIFPGFYNTLFDISESLGRFESDLKEHKLIDKDLDWDNSSFEREVLQECYKWVAKRLAKESGVFNIRLEGVVSPKEYNFRNDSGNIELDLDIEKFSSWFSNYIKEHSKEWEDHLEGHYTSCDGFISSYSNQAEDWADDTNNYRFDEKRDDDKYYRDQKIINGVHSLGRCLEFYLENEDKDARYAMYEFCCERVCAANYILNLPELDYELLDKHNIEGLRF